MKILQEAGTYTVFDNTPEEALKIIEFAGRTCHQSLDKMREDSAEVFIKKVMKRGHESILEHRPLLFIVEPGDITRFMFEYMEFKEETEASAFTQLDNSFLVSMNIRTLRDAARKCSSNMVRLMFRAASDKYPVLFHDMRDNHDPLVFEDGDGTKSVTLYDTVEDLPCGVSLRAYARHTYLTIFFDDHSRGSSHEQVRHRRKCAYSQESTRYVKKNDLHFVLPPGMDPEGMVPMGGGRRDNKRVVDHVRDIQDFYCGLIDAKWPAQDARQFLPIGTVAKILHTTTLEQWGWETQMRAHKDAHWEIRRSYRRVLAYCLNTWSDLPCFYRRAHLLGPEGEEHLMDLKDKS